MPLYHQLKASLMKDIDAGRWRPGEQLPTEDALIERFHVSKITVRQALRDLQQLGYIRREVATPGKQVEAGGSAASVANLPFAEAFK